MGAVAQPAKPTPAPAAAPAHGIDFSPQDDDFDMHIERDFTGPASSSHYSGAPASGPVSKHGDLSPRASSGLEVTHRRLDAQRKHAIEVYEPSLLVKVIGPLLALVVTGGAAFGLVRYAHKGGGFSPMAHLPHAFDGTSMTTSAVVSLVTLALAIALGFLGVRLRPRSWAFVASAAVLLLMALAMVTVALASTGENSAPPDGALLLPYLMPVFVALLGLGVTGRAANAFTREGIAPKLATIPLAALAGAILFAAYETSRFGAL
ncbi:hypothetical protein AKJ09_01102 [Labilithrix luteola]|uniref:Uncharacterized protein n=1 Tax=Labilithrix luteola TaxID=1391654 RepID=A0A0K1PLM6_9BACT|nr:hypothetical protein [Labilithrix luteola]AKU94438.1 hypothetical protein AKJ09_01102 [Labilithrix luteola]